MDPIVGSGKHTYDVNENWARAPEGIDMKPAAVAVDSHDRVFCFNRSNEHPVVIFDRDGAGHGGGIAGVGASGDRLAEAAGGPGDAGGAD
jgi:hypothetical protein